MHYDLDHDGDVSYIFRWGITIAVGTVTQDIKEEIERGVMSLDSEWDMKPSLVKFLDDVLGHWNDSVTVKRMQLSDLRGLLIYLVNAAWIDL